MLEDLGYAVDRVERRRGRGDRGRGRRLRRDRHGLPAPRDGRLRDDGRDPRGRAGRAPRAHHRPLRPHGRAALLRGRHGRAAREARHARGARRGAPRVHPGTSAAVDGVLDPAVVEQLRSLAQAGSPDLLHRLQASFARDTPQRAARPAHRRRAPATPTRWRSTRTRSRAAPPISAHARSWRSASGSRTLPRRGRARRARAAARRAREQRCTRAGRALAPRRDRLRPRRALRGGALGGAERARAGTRDRRDDRVDRAALDDVAIDARALHLPHGERVGVRREGEHDRVRRALP